MMPDRGLYAILDVGSCRQSDPVLAAEQAIQGGVKVLQLRDKHSSAETRLQLAEQIITLCRKYGVISIINDAPSVARQVQADGVHIGRDDAALKAARTVLGPRAIIGVSCYNDIERAEQMQAAGADYVAFGRFFPSRTKPEAPPATVTTLQQAQTRLHIPIVAIGGITPDNGHTLLAAGADMLAAIDSIFGQQNIEFACRNFQTLFTEIDQT